MEQKLYKLNEFAKLINVDTRTLQRWDKSGKLVAFRTPTDRRFYTHKQYLEFMGYGEETEVSNTKKVAIYARVSSRNQKDDLENQIQFLRTFANANGYIIENVYTDIASGLNFKRKQWNKLIQDCLDGKISTIIIAHKDRFCRFGFDWFESFLKRNNVNIIVVNNEKLSPQQELVQDLISIIHVFSCRVYGLRKYKKEIIHNLDNA